MIFFNQLKQNNLNEALSLSSSIAGISAATLSARALTKITQLVFF